MQAMISEEVNSRTGKSKVIQYSWEMKDKPGEWSLRTLGACPWFDEDTQATTLRRRLALWTQMRPPPLWTVSYWQELALKAVRSKSAD